MPRGLPDFGLLQTQTVSIEEGGINQSAYDIGFARMDGGGRVVFFDDFRAGANRWDLYQGGVGLAPYFKNDIGVGAGFFPSLYFDPVGATGYSFAELASNLPVSGKIGFEFGYHLLPLHGEIHFQVTYWYTANVSYVAKFRLDNYTDTVGYWNGSTYVDLFPLGNPGVLLGINLSIKFVVDSVNGLYDYLLVSDYKIPMGYPMQVGSSLNLPGKYIFHIENYGADASFKKAMYLNYLVVSADEP